LDTAVDSVPIPIARQKTGQKGGPKAVLTDDVKLKLAQHISSELDARHVLLISGKRGKNHVVDEMLELTNEYLFPSQITKATLNKWIFECIAECVEWEAEFSTEEKDGGSILLAVQSPRFNPLRCRGWRFNPLRCRVRAACISDARARAYAKARMS
jgi:hypothetical protein